MVELCKIMFELRGKIRGLRLKLYDFIYRRVLLIIEINLTITKIPVQLKVLCFLLQPELKQSGVLSGLNPIHR